MGIEKTISCDIKDCDMKLISTLEHKGFKNWGVVQGRVNEKGESNCYLCPKHLDKCFEFIQGKD